MKVFGFLGTKIIPSLKNFSAVGLLCKIFYFFSLHGKSKCLKVVVGKGTLLIKKHVSRLKDTAGFLFPHLKKH